MVPDAVAPVVGLWDPGPYDLTRLLLKRGLALTYLLAFLVAAEQFRPLAGEDGLLPIDLYVENRAFRERPSLFYYCPDDRAIGAAAWLGVALAAAALVGLPRLAGPYATPAAVGLWGAMWLLYLSFVNAGQTFYAYGWESMLLEAGFLAVFLGGPDVATPAVVVWLFRWVLFRNMLGAGLIKIRGDDCWRELTCLDYHYETQPMPNPLSWRVHHLSDRVHRLGVVTNHVVELAVPVFYFAPEPLAAVAGVVTVAFQGWLMLSGNFSWLNFLTAVLAVATLDDDLLVEVTGVAAPAVAPTPTYLWVLVGAVTLLVVALSYYPVRNMVSEGQRMNAAFDPLHLVNTYGAFGSITRMRYEVVVEGTDEERITPDTEWRAYEFEGKPTDTGRRPPQWAPYHLRLDWQLWFAAMSPSPRRHPWFLALVAKLLLADPGTLSLVREDPFDGDRPEHVRAVRYRYRFTTPEERAATGDYWHRERVGTYYGPVSLSDPRFRRNLDRLGLLPEDYPEPQTEPGTRADPGPRTDPGGTDPDSGTETGSPVDR